MTYLELARTFDGRDMPLEAAWAYEIAIQHDGSGLDTFLDLAALYFVICDTGYAATHRLEKRFVDVCYDRALEILQLAEKSEGPHPEIAFWRLYMRERVLGDTVAPAEYLKLAFSGASLMPYLALYAGGDGKDFAREVQPLLSASRLGRTARERYVWSFAPPR